MQATFILWAFGIIRDKEGKVLWVQRNDIQRNGDYLRNLPWWQVEEKESPRDATIREVKEETEFDVEIVKLTGIYTKDFKNEVCFVFECKVIWWELTLNEEARAFSRWSLEELPKAISERQVARVRDFLTQENTLTTRIETTYW